MTRAFLAWPTSRLPESLPAMEAELIRWLRERLPTSSRLRIGLGDDAAWLPSAQDVGDSRGSHALPEGALLTVDMLMDGVDFVLADIDPARAGRKALAVNLSDIAAMGGRPVAALVALCLPRQGGFELAQRLYEGMLPLAEAWDVVIAGGDVNSWDGPLVMSVTLVGEPRALPPWTRSGARPGDALLVTGALGGSRLGKHLDFDPRLDVVDWLWSSSAVHAAIDISDGLSLDLARLVSESGCGAEIVAQAVPVSAAATEWARRAGLGQTPLEHALSDGEDFELILAVEASAAESLLRESPTGIRLTRVGQCVAEQGLWLIRADGRREALAARGYEHRLTRRQP